MGTRSMPSGEVTLHGAYALQVGELDRGFRQMTEMLNTSRLSNAMRSAGLMRRAVRDMLAKNPLVKDFDFAERAEGGEGVTVAHFVS